MPRHPVPAAAPDNSFIHDMAQRAGRLGATLSASAHAVRLVAASRLAEMRKGISAEMLRDEAIVLARRLRQRSLSLVAKGREMTPDATGSATPQEPSTAPARQGTGRSPGELIEAAKALHLKAATHLDSLQQSASPPALVPTPTAASTLHTRLSQTGAHIEALSSGGAAMEPAQGGQPAALPPLQELAAIAVNVAPQVIQETAHEAAPGSGQVPLHAPAPRAAAGTMSRLRNDVLVRTALERPVLTGAAVIALGAVVAALSSAGAARQPRTATRRPSAEEAPSAVDLGRAEQSPLDARPRPAQADLSADAADATGGNGSPKTTADMAPNTRPRRGAKPASANGIKPRRPSSKPAGSAKSVTK